jgi:hypothetical protein
MKVVGCQPYAPAAFTTGINVVLIFRGWVDPRAHGTVRCHGKKPRRHRESIPGPSEFVAQCNGNISFVMSVRPLGTTLFQMDGFSWRFIFGEFLEHLSRKFMSDQNLTRTTSTLREDRFTFMTISRSIFLRTFRTKVVQKIKTLTSISKRFFFQKIVAFVI